MDVSQGIAVGVMAVVALVSVATLAKVTLDLSGKFVALANPAAHKQILDADVAKVTRQTRPIEPVTERPTAADLDDKLAAFRRDEWTPQGAADLKDVNDPHRANGA